MSLESVDAVVKHGIEIHRAGELSYLHARERQRELRELLLCGRGGEALLCCQHPAVFTLGRRTAEARIPELRRLATKLGVECIEVDRGGMETFHGPGQLLLYPVISLRRRHCGVKRFVETGLESIAGFLREYSVPAEASIENPGVWVRTEQGSMKKIAAVGVAIKQGISDHGFSVNIGAELSVFGRFNPCGCSETKVTSLASERATGIPDIALIEEQLYAKFLKDFSE